MQSVAQQGTDKAGPQQRLRGQETLRGKQKSGLMMHLKNISYSKRPSVLYMIHRAFLKFYLLHVEPEGDENGHAGQLLSHKARFFHHSPVAVLPDALIPP